MKKIFLVLFFAGSLIFQYLGKMPGGLLHVYFLNVGQGDSIFITTPENHHILIDGGPESAVLRELGEVMLFFDRTIDLLILTHSDKDHLFGLIEVVKRYHVKKILLTTAPHNTADYQEFLKLISRKNIPLEIGDFQNDLKIDDLEINILYPFQSFFADKKIKTNNTAIVTHLNFFSTSILLAGDIEEPIENLLLEKYDTTLQSDIFKASHHGSRTSNTKEFLNAVQPEFVVIQSGQNNNYGHPHAEILQRFIIRNAKVLRNDYSGRIEFQISSQKIEKIFTGKQKFALFSRLRDLIFHQAAHNLGQYN